MSSKLPPVPELYEDLEFWKCRHPHIVVRLRELADELDSQQKVIEARKFKYACAGILGDILVLGGLFVIPCMVVAFVGSIVSLLKGFAEYYISQNAKENNRKRVEEAQGALREYIKVAAEEKVYNKLKELSQGQNVAVMALLDSECYWHTAGGVGGVLGMSGRLSGFFAEILELGVLVGKNSTSIIGSGYLDSVTASADFLQRPGIVMDHGLYRTIVNYFASGALDKVDELLYKATAVAADMAWYGLVATAAGFLATVVSLNYDIHKVKAARGKMNSSHCSDVAAQIRNIAEELQNIKL